MNHWLLENKEIISVYSTIIQTLAAIAIPIIVGMWAKVDQKRKYKENIKRIEQKEIEIKNNKFENYKEITIRFLDGFLNQAINVYAGWEDLDKDNKNIKYHIQNVINNNDDFEDVKYLLVYLKIIECDDSSSCNFILPREVRNDRDIYVKFLQYLKCIRYNVKNNSYDNQIKEYI